MRVGLCFDVRNPRQWARSWPELYARTLDIAAAADDLGAHAVWFSEHHLFDDGYLPQPLTLAAAVAARTRNVRIGTAVLLPAFRHPVHLAEEAALVDILSDGRLELGVGVGYRQAEFDAFGIDVSRRYEALESRVTEVRKLFGEVTPPPVQDPVPLWGGFFGPRGARLAGRLGMGLLTIDAALMAPYRDGLQQGGHDPASARMGGILNLVLADDPEAAWARIAPHAAYQRDSYAAHSVRGTDQAVPPPVDPERLRRPGRDGRRPSISVLTPDEAFQVVREAAGDLPVHHVFFWAAVGAMPDDLVDRHVELVSTELAPRLA